MMGRELDIFSLYRSRETGRFVLLRTNQPEFPNYSQSQADLACEIGQATREDLLNYAAVVLEAAEKEVFELIGELQALPIGETLMMASGGMEVKVFYMNTEFGHPWIVLGDASSEARFLKELHEDENLLGLRPIGRPIMVTAQCFIANDAAFHGPAQG